MHELLLKNKANHVIEQKYQESNTLNLKISKPQNNFNNTYEVSVKASRLIILLLIMIVILAILCLEETLSRSKSSDQTQHVEVRIIQKNNYRTHAII